MQNSTRRELENNWWTFTSSIEVNRPYWDVFSSLVNGNTWVTAIAKHLKKDKSIVSRQMRTLEDIDLVSATGHGVKQSYVPNYQTIATFWIWSTEAAAKIVKDLKDWSMAPENIPDWQTRFYLTKKEHQYLKAQIQIHRILEPVIPQLSQIIQPVVESLARDRRIAMFFDAFEQISLSLAIALEEPSLSLHDVDIPANKAILGALFDPRIRAWLKYQSLISPGANVARNQLLKLCGLLSV